MNAHNDTQLIELASPNGLWRAEIGLRGAALRELDLSGVPIVVQTPSELFNTFAGVTLAPWPNRLADGKWRLGDREFTAEINEPARNNANHGLVHDRSFQVLNQNAHSLSLSVLLGGDPSYPFRVEVLVTYTLTDDGLRVSMGAISQETAGSPSVPFGFAGHPYYAVDSDSQLIVPAEKVMTADERLLPTGLAELDSIGMHHGQPAAVSQLGIDHCFTHLSPSPDGRVVTRLTRPSIGGEVLIWQQPTLKYLMIFTQLSELIQHPGAPIAIEPQSCPANALQSGHDLIWLEPEQSWSADWGIGFTETTGEG